MLERQSIGTPAPQADITPEGGRVWCLRFDVHGLFMDAFWRAYTLQASALHTSMLAASKLAKQLLTAKINRSG